MVFIPTTTKSFTGQLLYSDFYAEFTEQDSVEKISFLNRASTIPVVGIAAGVARCALAPIHIVGHLFAALIFWNKGHLAHVMKGAAEFGRGILEAIPLIGRIFANCLNCTGFYLGCRHCLYGAQPLYSFSIIKIYDPKKLDEIDLAMINRGYIAKNTLEDPSGGFFRTASVKP